MNSTDQPTPFLLGQLVTHPVHGLGIVISHDTVTEDGQRQPTGRVGVHFEPHPFLADPAYFWPEHLTAGPELPFQFTKAEDVPLAYCWNVGARHAAYGWSPRYMALPLNEAQRAAYDRGYAHTRRTPACP